MSKAPPQTGSRRPGAYGEAAPVLAPPGDPSSQDPTSHGPAERDRRAVRRIIGHTEINWLPYGLHRVSTGRAILPHRTRRRTRVRAGLAFYTVSKELCPPEPRQAKALPAANGDPPISN